MTRFTSNRLACAPALALVSFVLASCQPKPVGFEVRGLSQRDLHAYQQALREADLIFVGTLESFDAGWSGYSGIMAVCSNLRLTPSRVLRGSVVLGRSVEVENYMVGKSLWVSERSPEGGLRLSPSFFSLGARYVVFVSHRHQFCGHPSVAFVALASGTNASAIEADAAAMVGALGPF